MAKSKFSLAVLSLNLLIVATVVVAFAAAGTLFYTVAALAPSIEVGSPEISKGGIGGGGSSLAMTLPVTISNPGQLTLSDVSAQVSVKDSHGATLLTGSAGPVSIPAGARNVLTNFTVSFDLSGLPEETLRRLITEQELLSVTGTIGASMPPLASVMGSAAATIPWSPPLSNFSVGDPQFSPLNSSHARITVPVSFDNLSDLLPVVGTAEMSVYDPQGVKVGGGTLEMEAPKGSYSSGIVVIMALPDVSTLLTEDAVLEYRVVGSFSAYGAELFGEDQDVSLEWGAPVKDLALGTPEKQPYNSTHFALTVPVSFKDNSGFLPVQGTLSATIYDSSGSNIGGSGLINVGVPAGGTFSQTLTAYVSLGALSETSLTAELTFDTEYGTAQKVVVLNA